jgi:hypothetical protein
MKRIDVLLDDVLLEIFDFYMVLSPGYSKTEIERWQSLVHVCRRWRSLIFESPRRLNLQLVCTPFTPTRDKLDVWPALPLIVAGNIPFHQAWTISLPHLSRAIAYVESLSFILRHWQVQKILVAMQVPFPELTYLQLSSDDETSPAPLVIPDSFLGGFAPHLRHFFLDGIQFPESPTVLLSATTHLVTLWLAQYSSFWVHFTRDGRSPLHVVQPRNTFP